MVAAITDTGEGEQETQATTHPATWAARRLPTPEGEAPELKLARGIAGRAQAGEQSGTEDREQGDSKGKRVRNPSCMVGKTESRKEREGDSGRKQESQTAIRRGPWTGAQQHEDFAVRHKTTKGGEHGGCHCLYKAIKEAGI